MSLRKEGKSLLECMLVTSFILRFRLTSNLTIQFPWQQWTQLLHRVRVSRFGFFFQCSPGCLVLRAEWGVGLGGCSLLGSLSQPSLAVCSSCLTDITVCTCQTACVSQGDRQCDLGCSTSKTDDFDSYHFILFWNRFLFQTRLMEHTYFLYFTPFFFPISWYPIAILS
jgi:hypothetical protein